jgi:hypothetical protein
VGVVRMLIRSSIEQVQQMTLIAHAQQQQQVLLLERVSRIHTWFGS